jgi:hypothetical protein
MEEPNGDAQVAALIESLATRSDLETDRLATLLRHHCWPGGLSDRTERPALEWVRRWGPARVTEPALDCSCRQGRCSVCN